MLLCPVLFLAGCTVEAQDIAFGQDQCDSCRMTIVDRQHAAQFVTKKGKQFKYDSIECLVNALREGKKESSAAIILVADFEKGEMIPARSATYLICPAIESPMGAFLSAFQSEDRALAAKVDHEGELFTWETLKEHLSKSVP